MDEERYCTICERRIAVLIDSQTIQGAQGTMTLSLYSVSSMEPHCYGHQEAQPTGGLADLQMLCKRQITQETPIALNDSSHRPNYVFCPRCRYHIHIENVHTQADCDELQQGKIPQPEPVDVPQAFYEAFKDKELEL